MENNDRKWEVLHSEYLIQRPWLTARRDCVRLPNGVEVAANVQELHVLSMHLVEQLNNP